MISCLFSILAFLNSESTQPFGDKNIEYGEISPWMKSCFCNIERVFISYLTQNFIPNFVIAASLPSKYPYRLYATLPKSKCSFDCSRNFTNSSCYLSLLPSKLTTSTSLFKTPLKNRIPSPAKSLASICNAISFARDS